MPTKKTGKAIHTSSRKRCPNGSRKDKDSELCVKYDGFKVFKELKDQDISEKGTTVSIESLGEGGIIKLYKEGNMMEQKYISEEAIEKIKKKSDKQMQQVIKTLQKVKKNPKILNDKRFQRFKKKMDNQEKKGGGGPEGEILNIQVQEKTLNQLTNPRIQKLQGEVDRLQGLLDDLLYRRTKEETNDWWATIYIFNALESMGLIIGTNSGSAVLPTVLQMDIFGGICLWMMYIVMSTMPTRGEEDYDNILTSAQFIYWSFLLAFAPTLGLWGGLSTLVLPAFGMYNYFFTEKSPSANEPVPESVVHLQKRLEEAKKNLATELEKMGG